MEMESHGGLKVTIRQTEYTKKNYPFNAAWTSECSWRATVAPAAWTSSGLRAPHTGAWAGGPDGTCRGHWLIPLLKKKLTTFLDSCMSSLRLSMLSILFCITQANYFRHPYAGALLSSARADVEIFLRRHCRRRGKKNWQELRPMYRRDSSPEYSTRIPHVSPIPSYITARQQFPESCNSLLETAHTKEEDVSSQEPCCSKKNTICVVSVHAQVSFMSSQATLHQGRVNLCIVQI